MAFGYPESATNKEHALDTFLLHSKQLLLLLATHQTHSRTINL